MVNFYKIISRKLFIKSAIILVLFLAIDFSFRSLYLDIMKDSRLVKSEKFLKNKIKKPVKLLVLGDSHSGWSIWAHFFNFDIFKWISPGEGYVRNYYKLNYFLKKQKTKYVIIPVDLHSFSANRIKKIKQNFYWVKYIDYIELGKISNNFWLFFKKYLKGKYLPYLGESKTLDEWIIKVISKKKTEKKISKAGFRIINLRNLKKKVSKVNNFVLFSSKERIALSNNRTYGHFNSEKGFSYIMWSYLKKMIYLCKKKNIKVLLIKYPVSKEYFISSKKYVSNNLISHKINRLLKFKNVIGILDYRDIFFNYPQFMTDPDHVNRYGASIISRKINNYINIKEGNFKKKVFFQNSNITIISTSNIGKIEGPYKKKKLPKITWGIGPQSSIKYFSDKEQNVSLHLTYCNIFNNQKMQIIINKNFKREFVMEKTKLGDFKKILLPLLFKKGENSIIFNYAISNKVKGRRAIAVLFSKIHIY